MHHHRRPALLLLFLNLIASQGMCSPGEVPEQFPQLHFENITTSQGLSDNGVTCFYQDHEGFLWVGTRNGLNRYDGNHFRIFQNIADDANSVSGNYIIQIIQDREGVFWIATKDGGLSRYDAKAAPGKQFRQFTHDPRNKKSIATNRLNCLYDYDSTYLLIGAEEIPGIFLNKKTFEFSYWCYPNDKLIPSQASPEPCGIPAWIHAIKDGTAENFFLSPLHASRITYVNKSTGELYVDQKIVPPTETITCFVQDGNQFYFGGWKAGLFSQDVFLKPVADVSKLFHKVADLPDEVKDVSIFNTHYLIAATATRGIFLVDKITGAFLNLTSVKGDHNALSSNKVNCLFRDVKGIWWIGTENGISKYDPQQWQFIGYSLFNRDDEAEDGIRVFSVHEDEYGTLRVCTTAGIFKKRTEESSFGQIQFKSFSKKIQPTTIVQLDKEHWVMGSEQSVYNYDPIHEIIYPFPIDTSLALAGMLYPDELFQVRTIIPDSVSEGKGFWIGVLGYGLNFYLVKDKRIYYWVRGPDSSSIQNNLTRKILRDHSGNIWIATSNGLFVRERNTPFTENRFTGYYFIPGDSTSLSDNNIQDLWMDPGNHIWVLTKSHGLNQFDGTKFIRYIPFPEFGSVNYFGFAPDDGGNLWITTSKGLLIFNLITKKFSVCPLNNAAENPGFQGGPFPLRDGSFIVSEGGNLYHFHPDSVQFNKTYPEVFLTDFQLFNQSKWSNVLSGLMNYAHNKNFFTIYFSSLQLSLPATVHYQYKLDGLEKQWNEAGGEGKVNYTNVPPGSYTFKVRVTNQEWEWSPPITLVVFSVKSPFWFCWWFYVSCIAATAGIVYLIFRFRLKQLMKIQIMRNKIANDLHDDVGSALSTISLYSEVAKMKVNESERDLSDILDKITATSQEMQESMNYIVWSIQPRNDHVDQMVQRMKRYAIEMLQPRSICVNFEFDENLHAIKLSQEKRKELFLIFKEAVHNISKYANCRSVNILFSREDHHIKMEIIDDGIGFKKDQVISGNGLYTMYERAKSLKGKFHIHSMPERGTEVLLTFPFD